MSEESKASPLKEYKGSCHCGAFSFILKLPPIEKVSACNCAFCSRNAALFLFPQRDEDFVVEKGADHLKVYQFNQRERVQKFCPTCGSFILTITPTNPPDRKLAINARMMLDSIDLKDLGIEEFDGKSLPPPYQPPEPLEGLTPVEGKKVYHGNCHCGAVRYSVRSAPFNGVENKAKVTSCDCSICGRNGYLWIYPPKEDVVKAGEKHLSMYQFGKKQAGHRFCSICGVSMFNDIQHPKITLAPINIRTLNGVDFEDMDIGHYPPGITTMLA